MSILFIEPFVLFIIYSLAKSYWSHLYFLWGNAIRGCMITRVSGCCREVAPYYLFVFNDYFGGNVGCWDHQTPTDGAFYQVDADVVVVSFYSMYITHCTFFVAIVESKNYRVHCSGSSPNRTPAEILLLNTNNLWNAIWYCKVWFIFYQTEQTVQNKTL